MIWWEKNSGANEQSAAVRGILLQLEDEAGLARRRWAAEGAGHLSHCLQLLQQSEALLLTDTPIQFHTLAQRHDQLLTAAFAAAESVADGYQVLGALRRVAVLVEARQVDLAYQRSELPIWRRGSVTGELRALEQLQQETLDQETARITADRERLIAAVTQLLAQGARLRERLLAAFHGAARKWLQVRREWLRIGLENWERAQQGLRLHPLPSLSDTPINVRLEGIVKWYDAHRRRGMITPLNGGPEVHLPRSSLRNATRLHTGQRVGFTLRQSSIGPWAADVILIR